MAVNKFLNFKCFTLTSHKILKMRRDYFTYSKTFPKKIWEIKICRKTKSIYKRNSKRVMNLASCDFASQRVALCPQIQTFCSKFLRFLRNIYQFTNMTGFKNSMTNQQPWLMSRLRM